VLLHLALRSLRCGACRDSGDPICDPNRLEHTCADGELNAGHHIGHRLRRLDGREASHGTRDRRVVRALDQIGRLLD
jgi:hypothetical protein